MFFGNGIRVGRIGGIQITVDYSWFIIFALFVFLLAGTYLPTLVPRVSTGWYIGVAVITSLLFFSSVLFHELSHSLVARRNGIPINKITLFLFGGMAQMEDEPNTPWDEFKMAIAGPAASLLLGFVFLGLAAASRVVAELSPTMALIYYALFYLGFINFVLAIFNLLPGFPMDGGRVFRAALWRITGNLRRATYIASITGQTFGWVFILLGVGSLIFPPLRAFASIWLALIGWFLVSAARSSYQQVVMRDTLSHVPITEVMNTDIEAVDPNISVERLVTDYFLRESAATLPVEENGRLLGMVSVDDVRAVPRERWASTLVREILPPVTAEQELHPNNDAWDAANRMAQTERDRVIVTEDGHVEGVVTRGAIVRWLQMHGGFATGTGQV